MYGMNCFRSVVDVVFFCPRIFRLRRVCVCAPNKKKDIAFGESGPEGSLLQSVHKYRQEEQGRMVTAMKQIFLLSLEKSCNKDHSSNTNTGRPRERKGGTSLCVK
jgi:hypothetical protein